MKQKTLPFAFLLFTLLCTTCFAAPLSGVYTIGGTSPNYATFTLAVTDLNNNGVSGPVTFNVRTGVYSESITIDSLSGSSATNTVTFKAESGVASDVSLFRGATLSAASFITFTYFTIGTSGGIVLNGACNNVSITHVVISGSQGGFGSDLINGSSFVGSNLLIANDSLIYGRNGINLAGVSDAAGSYFTGAVIQNNILYGFSYSGIQCGYHSGTLIEGNMLIYSPGFSYGTIGMTIQYSEYPIQVIKNKIIETGTNRSIAGMYIINNHPTSLSNGSLIADNFLSMQYCSDAFFLINCDYFRFYNNSVIVNTEGGCFYAAGTGNLVADNIFQGVGPEAVMTISPGTNVTSSDYNDIYTTGTAVGNDQAVLYPTLAAWQTASGFEAHSKAMSPPFVSTSDLHLIDYTGWNFAVPETLVPTDIDGNLRNPLTPDVGAAEAINPAQFASGNTKICIGGSVSFTDHSTGSPTGWNWTFSGGIPQTSTAQNPTVAYDTVGTYTVKLVVTYANGVDSVIVPGYVKVNPLTVNGTVSAARDTLCNGAIASLGVNGNVGSIQWQSSYDGISFNSLNGDSFANYQTDNLFQTVYYRAVIIGVCSADTSNIQKIIVYPYPVDGTINGSPDTVCPGGTSVLTLTGSSGNIQWQSSSNGSIYTNLLNDTSATYHTAALTQATYYRVKMSNYCRTDSATTHKILISNSPNAGSISANPASICSGSTSTIRIIGSIGSILWQSSTDGTSFTNISGQTTSSYTTPVLTQGAYYRAKIIGTCGVDTTAVQVVNVITQAVAGLISSTIDTICSGDTVHLSVTGSAAPQLQWQSSVDGNSYIDISGADSTGYIGTLNQVSYFRVVAGSGACADTSASFLVTVNPLPVSPLVTTADSIICPSDFTVINSTGLYTSYLWSDGDTTPYTYASQAGTYRLSVSDVNGCTAVSNQQVVLVYPEPGGPYFVIEGDTLISFGGSSYQWYFNDVLIGSATGAVYVTNCVPGNYGVQLTDTNGCTIRSADVMLVCSGISEMLENTGLSVYPDPFTDIIYLKPASPDFSLNAVELLDESGRRIYTKEFNRISNSLFSINIPVLPSGVYFLKIMAGETEYVKKVVKL